LCRTVASLFAFFLCARSHHHIISHLLMMLALFSSSQWTTKVQVLEHHANIITAIIMDAIAT
jgi:hypothetical protein